jgi:hypothetical protein
LCIISWLAWFLVACVVSKKFIKFLRKSLKEFDLNLKRKVVLKRSLKKKEKKKTVPSLPFGPNGPAAHHPSPRAGPHPLSLFSFSLLSLTPRPHLSASPLPLPFLLPHPAARPAAAAADPAAPRLFPFLSFLTRLAN